MTARSLTVTVDGAPVLEIPLEEGDDSLRRALPDLLRDLARRIETNTAPFNEGSLQVLNGYM